jgi:hypothetical protein
MEQNDDIARIDKIVRTFQSVLGEIKKSNEDDTPVIVHKYTKKVTKEEENAILDSVNKYYSIAEKVVLGDSEFGSVRKAFSANPKLIIAYFNRWCEYEFNVEIMEKSMVVINIYLQELINESLTITDLVSEILSHYDS